MLWRACGGQKTNWGIWFCPSTVYVGPAVTTQVVRLSGKCLDLLSPLSDCVSNCLFNLSSLSVCVHLGKKIGLSLR